MKSVSLIAVLSALVALVASQVTFNTTTDVFDCAKANANYCGGDSLETNIIIRCADFVGQPGNCNDNLAGIPPLGVKTFAPCYQVSVTAGDAACSFGGIVYPDVGKSFPIPSGNTKTSSSLAATSSTNNASSSTGTSLALSSTANAAVNTTKPYPFGSTADIGGVKKHTAATRTSLESNTKASIVTPHLFIASGNAHDPSRNPYFAFKNGWPAPFPTIKTSLSYGTSLSKSTAVSVGLNLLIASALPESLPFLPGVGPGFQASANIGNSTNHSTAPSGTAVGTGRPSMTSSSFLNSADVTSACVWTIMVGVMGLGVALL